MVDIRDLTVINVVFYIIIRDFMFGKKKLTANRAGIKIIPKAKRESFLPSDKAWLDKNSDIELGNWIGGGAHGDVYEVYGNNNLVVKIPIGNDPTSKPRIEAEADICKNLDTNNQLYFTPTKVSRNIVKDRYEKCVGLVRPKVKPIEGATSDRIFDNIQVEKLRQRIIAITKQGYVLEDGIQVGVDRAGRILQFDMDFIRRGTKEEAFARNRRAWIAFLLNNKHIYSPSEMKNLAQARRRCLQQYGDINVE